MDSGTVVSVVTDVQAVGDAILLEVESLIPGAAVPAAAAQKILDLLASLLPRQLPHGVPHQVLPSPWSRLRHCCLILPL